MGITGGVGCGKSSVARMLKDKYRVVVIDVDRAGRMAVDDQPEIRHKLREVFGEHVFSGPDELNRRTMGQIVFSDRSAREKLNRIVHPVMLAIVREEIEKAQEINSAPYIAVDAALIFELELDKILDATITVCAPLNVCIDRAGSRTGLSKQEIRDRMRAQIPLKEKKRRSDYLIDNGGTLTELERRVDQLHKWLLRRAGQLN